MHKLFTGVYAADAGQHKRWDLQLFAGEGAASGGEGGDGSSAAGAQSGNDTMDSLGIPQHKLDRYRANKAKQAKPAVSQEADEAEPAPVAEEKAAASDQAEQGSDPEAAWNEILKNPEYNSRIQDIVQKRVRSMQNALDALAPALETLGQKYGMDVSDVTKMDLQELSKRINEDDSYFEDRAEEMGSSPETARKVFQAELYEKRREASVNEEMARRHYDDLVRQGEELKAKIPNFDLQRELQDPRFARMTAPGGGWNVEQAFNAVHHDALVKLAQEQAARQASQALSNSIQAGKSIPAENGSVQRSAQGTQTKLYSQMTPEERAVYKAQITGRPIGR